MFLWCIFITAVRNGSEHGESFAWQIKKWSSEGLEWVSLYHHTLQEVPWCYEASEFAQEEKGSRIGILEVHLVCSHCTLM